LSAKKPSQKEIVGFIKTLLLKQSRYKKINWFHHTSVSSKTQLKKLLGFVARKTYQGCFFLFFFHFFMSNDVFVWVPQSLQFRHLMHHTRSSTLYLLQNQVLFD